jgi:NSS family neurotransmitter:Na+ symporter
MSLKSSAERVGFASRIGFLGATLATSGGIAYVVMAPYVAYGNYGAAYWVAFIIGFAFVVIAGFLAEAGLGVWGRRAYPSTVAKLKYGRLWELIAWIVILGGGGGFFYGFNASYAVVLGYWLSYLVMSPFKAWGSDPVTYFWEVHLTNFLAVFIPALIIIGIWWFIEIKGVEFFGMFSLAGRLITMSIAAIMFIASFIIFPNAWQGMAYCFHVKPEALLYPGVWSTALIWAFWITGIGLGNMTVFASYLPKGGDVNTTAIIGPLAHIFTCFLSGLALFNFAIGTGVPPVWLGSLGLAFTGMPKVWNTIGIAAIPLSLLFYSLVFWSALPCSIAWFENINAALMDKFGWPRSKSVNLLIITTIFGAVIFSWPTYYEPWGTSYGFTLISTLWFWEAFFCATAAFVLFVIVLFIFKPDKLLSILNEHSTIKLPKAFFYALLVIGLVASIFSMYYTAATFSPVDAWAPGFLAGLSMILWPVILGVIIWSRR